MSGKKGREQYSNVRIFVQPRQPGGTKIVPPFVGKSQENQTAGKSQISPLVLLERYTLQRDEIPLKYMNSSCASVWK